MPETSKFGPEVKTYPAPPRSAMEKAERRADAEYLTKIIENDDWPTIHKRVRDWLELRRLKDRDEPPRWLSAFFMLAMMAALLYTGSWLVNAATRPYVGLVFWVWWICWATWSAKNWLRRRKGRR